MSEHVNGHGDRPTVVVAGLYRSGSTCTAGVLFRLGLHLGDKFRYIEAVHGAWPHGDFEDLELFRLCMKAYKEPYPDRLVPDDQVVAMLSGYFAGLQAAAAAKGTMAATKHPLLCAMLPEIKQVVPNLKVVSVMRPIEESIRSMLAREWWKHWHCTPDDCEAFQRHLWQQREANIGDTDHLEVPYADLLADPKGHIDRIADFLGHAPTEQQRRAADRQVYPHLKHF